jgi:putative addiction module killer protein
MIEVRQTEEFSGWLRRLILEMRVDYRPGYRIYYVHRGAQIVILLCGGDKRTQQQDIKRARKLAETL